MRLDLLLLTLLAGVAFYIALTHALIALDRRQPRYNLSFAIFCLGVGLYDILCAGLYSVNSPIEGIVYQKLQRIVLCPTAVAFLWFIAAYTGHRARRFVMLLTVAFSLLLVAMLLDPGDWFWTNVPAVKRVTLPFGATVVYQEMQSSYWSHVQHGLGLLVFVYAFSSALRLLRTGSRHRAYLMITVLTILFVSVANDIAVVSGVSPFPYLMEYGFFALVFMMGYALLRRVLRASEMETALRDSEQRYRGFVEGTNDFIAQIDRRGRFTFVNHSLAEALGYASEECKGRVVREFLPEGERPMLRKIFDQWLRDRVANVTVERSFVNARGKSLVVLWTITADRGENGAIDSFNCIGRDITRRKRNEEMQLEHLDRLQAQQAIVVALATSEDVAGGAIDSVARAVSQTGVEAMSVARSGVWRLSDDARTLMSLAIYDRALGHQSEAAFIDVSHCPRFMESLRMDRIIPTVDAQNDPRTRELTGSYLAPQGIVSCLEAPIRAGGRLFGVLSYEHAGEARAWTDDEIGFACDVAEQLAQTVLNAERSRAEAERRLLTGAIEQAAEIVVITDFAGSIQYVNPAFERVTGYAREEALGRNPRILKSERQSPAFYEELWRTISNGGTWRGRFTNRKKDDSLYLEEAVISPVVDKAGRITHYVSVKRDITEEVRREDQLRHALKMEAIGQLAGGVAHDFNNLLTPILGYAELLLMMLPAGDESRPSLTEIHKAAANARDLTQQLLAFGRKQLIEMRVLDPGEVVARFAKILRRTIREDIEIVLRLAPARGQIRGDPTQIEHILMNLAVNAQDAMPHGGIMTIEADSVFLGESYSLRHPGMSHGPYVVLSVSDNGVGMDAETIEHIFEPFFTTKDKGKGTGLGLATVYGVVKQHGGEIFVQSEPGCGTTFKIYLPRVEQQPEELETAASVAAPLRGVETIAVVEDSRMVRELTAHVLREYGYTVIEAGGPEECQSILAEHQGVVHLLVADVIMPGMNGKELYLKLLESRPSLKVLFMSGYTDDVINHHGILERGTHFIQKPYTVEGLLLKVRAALEDASESSALFLDRILE